MHMNYLNLILAQAAPATGQPMTPTQSLISNPIVFIGLMLVMMYFIVFRPQQLRAKQQRKLLEALKSGDEVVTAAGIIGTVITVKDRTVTLRSGDAKFEVTKASITELVVDASTPAKA
jgi:preprotein translocase subunit YajC